MGMSSSGSKRLSAAINVTPLIDVLLVLLIIFMVIQPRLFAASTPSSRSRPNPLPGQIRTHKQSSFRSSATKSAA